MSRRCGVYLGVLVATWWSVTAGSAAGQSLDDILRALGGGEQPAAEEAQPVASPEQPTDESVAAPPIDSVEAGYALKEALLIAAENATAQASQVDGFDAHPEIRVGLPATLAMARDTLARFGLGQQVDDLELALNRAAEGTAAEALPLLTAAVRDLVIENPTALVGAGGSAATDALRAGAKAALVERLMPVTGVNLERTEAGRAFDRLVAQGGALATQAGVTRADLTPYVAGRTLDGLFTLMAAGEVAIRTDPAARTSPLLTRVFGPAASTSTGAADDAQQAAAQPEGDDVKRALKQALVIGARKAVERASQADGFGGNPKLRIPLPQALTSLGQSLRSFGMGQVVDEFELSMNRAAEEATAKATPILVDAVKSVTFGDAMAILRGGDRAATDVLRAKTEAHLGEVFEPIITQAMDDVGVTRSYERVMERAGSFAALLGGDRELDLPAYVTGKTLDGLFELVAEEEAKIRKDPLARTTDLLTRIFGSLGG